MVTNATGRTLGLLEEDEGSGGVTGAVVEVGAVVMYFDISSDFLCHCDMMERYSTKESTSPVVVSVGLATTMGVAGVEESAISVSVVVGVAATTGSIAAGAGDAVVPQTLTAKEGSLLRYSLMKDPISANNSASVPSTATTAPLISCAGLPGPGSDKGGEILVRTLILLMYGIVMTIASTLFA